MGEAGDGPGRLSEAKGLGLGFPSPVDVGEMRHSITVSKSESVSFDSRGEGLKGDYKKFARKNVPKASTTLASNLNDALEEPKAEMQEDALRDHKGLILLFSALFFGWVLCNASTSSEVAYPVSVITVYKEDNMEAINESENE
ncbi:hypothetical protein NE237_024201 [Protea cynaroides]|uniref:Uncharacterized protein n=1 Tax=Protea cynaroides TaxID=273540 RepID=A0A9Q0K639_9MAGN|nr:hypothetical protein NE237_024201 [Protea cynaroides]